MFPADLTIIWEKVQRSSLKVCFNSGNKSRSELDDPSCVDFLTGVGSECKYAGCLDDSGTVELKNNMKLDRDPMLRFQN